MYNSFALTGSKGQAAPDEGEPCKKHNEVFVVVASSSHGRLLFLNNRRKG